LTSDAEKLMNETGPNLLHHVLERKRIGSAAAPKTCVAKVLQLNFWWATSRFEPNKKGLSIFLVRSYVSVIQGFFTALNLSQTISFRQAT
jgi:hypothetical protein